MKTVQFGVIGSGSIFTPELTDLLAQSIHVFGRIVLKMMDIDQARQQTVGGLCQRIIQKYGVPIEVQYVDSYQQAIAGSDYILVQFRVGGEDARIADELLGKKYRIPFVETVSVCGFATFLRTYYEVEKIAPLIVAYAPDAWVLNFANPAGLVAEALSRHGVKKVIGVCNASTRLLQFLQKKLDFTWDNQVYMNWRGLNHLTVVDRFEVDGKNRFPEILQTLADYESDRIPFPAALVKKLGFLPNQYFQYYYLERSIVQKEQTAGQVRSQLVKEINAALLAQYKTIDYVPEGLTKRGGSGYSRTVVEVIRSLFTGDNKIHYIVTQNRGAIPELPYDGFVEAPCAVGKDRVHPIACEKLPAVAASLIRTMKDYETLLLQAAQSRDCEGLYRSLMLHPLIGCHCVAEPLLHDVLCENQAFLPAELKE